MNVKSLQYSVNCLFGNILYRDGHVNNSPHLCFLWTQLGHSKMDCGEGVTQSLRDGQNRKK